jgi:hypothetical protein
MRASHIYSMFNSRDVPPSPRPHLSGISRVSGEYIEARSSGSEQAVITYATRHISRRFESTIWARQSKSSTTCFSFNSILIEICQDLDAFVSLLDAIVRYRKLGTDTLLAADVNCNNYTPE